jgi:hypothetical protein
MDPTEVIAAFGAVTGTAGSVLGIMSYRRDRAKIEIHTKATWGRGPLHDSFFLHIEVANEGRRPATILQVDVLKGRRRGLRTPLRLARSERGRNLIAKVGQIDQISTPLASYEQPIVLAGGERQQYTLRAKEFNARRSGEPAWFTYVRVVDLRRRVLAKRVAMDGVSDSWDQY